jgi:uncharacterized protein (TIGR00288 family)
MPKIALLIDAENISYKDLPRILEEVRGQGQIALRAVYGDWQSSHLQKWEDIAEANNFKIRRQTSSLKTKNSSDLKLIMDAMEVLYRTPLDVFCIVSNDADYVPLCDKIHEAKKRIIGVGYQHAAETFIRACDRFIFIGRGEVPVQSIISITTEIPVILPQILVQTPKSASPQSPTNKSTTLPDIRKLLSQVFIKAPQDVNQWVTVQVLWEQLCKLQAGFQTSHYGHETLNKLLQSMPDFVEIQRTGGVNSARLKKNIPSNQPVLNTVQKLISDAFATLSCDPNGWITVQALGHAMRKVQSGFKSNTYGHSTLSKLLQSMPDFVEVRGKGSTLAARLKK